MTLECVWQQLLKAGLRSLAPMAQKGRKKTGPIRLSQARAVKSGRYKGPRSEEAKAKAKQRRADLEKLRKKSKQGTEAEVR